MVTIVKRVGKSLLCAVLESQVRRLRSRTEFKIVCVAGSVGKTSTKFAVAQLLSASQRVRYQEGNYNDRLTVPLVVFGHAEPSIFNIVAWMRILLANEGILRRQYPYDYVVLELGTDGPGQIRQFDYLQPDLTIVTAVAEEHMEYFGSLDAVAQEELAVAHYSKALLLNVDDIAATYLPQQSYKTYGLQTADYVAANRSQLARLEGQSFDVALSAGSLQIQTSMLGAQGAKICLAAIAAGDMLGLSVPQLMQGAGVIHAAAGRMQVLPGIKGSVLLDDTYNASPLAVTAALDVLYKVDAPQRIAILGSMNEMGEVSAQLHQQVGAYCDPAKLDAVVVIGKQAAENLAPAAAAVGCKVVTFSHPQTAGEHVASIVEPGAVVLAKGSQNGVFAEEALVPLLADQADAAKLVRQSPYWQKAKTANLPKS